MIPDLKFLLYQFNDKFDEQAVQALRGVSIDNARNHPPDICRLAQIHVLDEPVKNGELFQKIEDFRFKNRHQTRFRATAELICRGLEQLEKEEKEAPRPQGRG